MMERLKEGEWVDDWHKSGFNPSKAPIDMGCHILDDYRFSYNLDGAPFGENYTSASLEPETNSLVYGVLWNISNNDLNKLDIDEDLPRAYVRKCLAVKPCESNANKIFAWVYVGQPDVKSATESPEPEYVELIEKGAMAHSFPKNYIDDVICRGQR